MARLKPAGPPGFPLTAERLRAIRRRLLGWYDRHKRDLPWRQRPGDGYAQLLAEFMLQQTQVSTVIDYYNRFLDRFPTVADLAAAPRDDVLALWSGLGYYRRARNLHAAARQIMADHHGKVPADVESLMTLPGVGRYTAGAIASVAYDTRAPLVDGNVTRVLTRLLAIAEEPTAVQPQLWSAAETLLPSRRCGDFNQALMELGATLCGRRSPECRRCPLRVDCRAHRDGLTDRIPPVARRTPVLAATLVVAAIRRGTKLLFTQRPDQGLWAGLWELPTEPVRDDEPLNSARRRLRQKLPAACRLSTRAINSVTRQLTHRRVTFHTFCGATPTSTRCQRLAGQPARWIAQPDLPNFGVSRASEAIIKLIGW